MSGSIRVLSVCTSDSLGGAARAAYQIYLAVLQFGIDGRMFVKDKKTSDNRVIPLDDFVPHNVFYNSFDWMRNKVKNKWQQFQWKPYSGRSPYFMSDLRSTDICGALQKIDYDVLHLHWINLRFLSLKDLPKNKPILWTLHDSWPFCGVCHLPMDCLAFSDECGSCPALGSVNPKDLSNCVWESKRKAYCNLDLHFVAPSRWMADCARRSSLLGNRDIHVIPNCLDTNVFCPGNRDEACLRFGLDPKRRHILFGAMNALEDKNKGFDFLAEAMNQIGTRLSSDTDLVVFGTTRFPSERLGGLMVNSLGVLYDTVDIASVYKVADVTVVPSLSENLSCTVMESLSCGVPTVAFNIGGNGDLIDHQINGYLAKERDVEDLSKGIIWCLENNKDGVLSRNARKKVLDNYTPEIVGKQYAELYSSLEK